MSIQGTSQPFRKVRSTMNIVTAEIAKIQIGQVSFDGVMFPDGSYGIAVPQIVELNLVPPDRSRKQLEALTGMVFQTHQKAKTKLHPKAVNVIGLNDFEKLTFELAMNGHLVAQKFVRDLYGLSLHQLFSDAFNVKFEKEDRQRWLETRFNTKHDFRPLTDCLQLAGFKEPKQYGKYIHLMQTKIGIQDGTRDELDFPTLNKLERAQNRLTAYMECGLTPMQALHKL